MLFRSGEMLEFLRFLITSQGIVNWGAWHLPWHCQILPEEPLLQPSPGLPKQTGAWPRGNPSSPWNTSQGRFHPQGTRRLRNHRAHTGWATILPKASKAPGNTPALQRKPWTPSTTRLPLVQGFAGTMAGQQLLPRGRRMNRHKNPYLTHTIAQPGCPCRFTRHLFAFPRSLDSVLVPPRGWRQ